MLGSLFLDIDLYTCESAHAIDLEH